MSIVVEELWQSEVHLPEALYLVFSFTPAPPLPPTSVVQVSRRIQFYGPEQPDSQWKTTSDLSGASFTDEFPLSELSNSVLSTVIDPLELVLLIGEAQTYIILRVAEIKTQVARKLTGTYGVISRPAPKRTISL